MTTDAPVPDDVIASDVVQAAIDDLVERTGADRSAIEVASVDEVEWPDGSLGCPQPGMSYTQAIVNGTKIVLRLDGFPTAGRPGWNQPSTATSVRPARPSSVVCDTAPR